MYQEIINASIACSNLIFVYPYLLGKEKVEFSAILNKIPFLGNIQKINNCFGCLQKSHLSLLNLLGKENVENGVI